MRTAEQWEASGLGERERQALERARASAARDRVPHFLYSVGGVLQSVRADKATSFLRARPHAALKCRVDPPPRACDSCGSTDLVDWGGGSVACRDCEGLQPGKVT